MSCSLVPTSFLFIVVLVFGRMLKWVPPRLLQIHTNNILVHLRLKYKKTGFLCLSAVCFDVVGPRRLHSFRVSEKQMRRSLVYASWQTVSLICVSVLAWEDARRRNRCDEASPWPPLGSASANLKKFKFDCPRVNSGLVCFACSQGRILADHVKWHFGFLGILALIFFFLKMIAEAWKRFGTRAAVLTACVIKLLPLPPNEKAHKRLMDMACAAAGKEGAFTGHVG